MNRNKTQYVWPIVVGARAGLGGAFAADMLREAPPPIRLREAPRAVEPDDERLVELEARLARLERAPAPAAERPVDEDEQSTFEVEAKPEPMSKSESILEGLLDGAFTQDDSDQLYLRLSKHRGSIDSTIRELEKAIEQDPRNADLHCLLAVAWGAKTAYVTPSGPQQGVTWAKATAAYNEAIKIDPGHWQARYGIAFGNAMAPEFVGLRPKAIQQFEELMIIQEARTPHGDHVQVYVQLGNLYKGAGNIKKARTVWQRGLQRHPDQKALTESLDLLPKD